MTLDAAPAFSTLIDVLRYRSEHQEPGTAAYIYLTDGATQEQRLTYRELDRQARAIAACLQRVAPLGARAVLLYPPDLNYLAAFFGCLYAGVIAVPAYPPDPARLSRTLPRLQAIFADADAEFVLTTSEILGVAQFIFTQAPDLATKKWIASDGLEEGVELEWKVPQITPSDVAFLQYTSGSTGAPKGVMLGHDNLINNLELISNAFEIDDSSVGVSWLPPYHDMGLIGGILAPLYRGRPTALMSPVAFLQKPLRWLHAVSRYRATISGGPNFAYELCVRKATEHDLRELDLSTWSVAFTGAEPVRPETLDRFERVFAPCGFRRTAYYPCYGLAEATLIVSGGEKVAEPVIETIDPSSLLHNQAVRVSQAARGARPIVGCGFARGNQTIAVVNPATLECCLPGDVGEIWLAGPSVAKGYWRRPEETEKAFHARPAGATEGSFLRTGDLGFVRAGNVFITGRFKDIVIIRGRNHYPQDIEVCAEESHPALRRGCCAAFAVDIMGEEQLVVAVEVERRFHERRRSPSTPPGSAERRGKDRRNTDAPGVEDAGREASALGADQPGPLDEDEVCEAIRRGVQEHHDLHVHEVLLVRPGMIPKTSSGKIQRTACRTAYGDGSLEVVASNVLRTSEHTRKTSLHAADLRDVVRGLPLHDREQWLERFLADQVSKALKTSVSKIEATKPLSGFGLDSLLGVEIVHRIEKRLGVLVPMTTFLRDTTLRDLASAVAAQVMADVESDAVAPSGSDEARLSAGQEALWFLQDLAPSSAAYNLDCAFLLTSAVDVDVLRRAFEALCVRHEILRTTYPSVAGRVVRRLHSESTVDFVHVNAPVDDLDERLAAEAARPFDLENGPLVRVFAYATNRGHVVHVVMHHVASDLWSIVTLLKELAVHYDGMRGGKRAAVKPLSVTYTDFVRWQRDFIDSEAGNAARRYWQRTLQGDLPMLDLPTDRPRMSSQTYRGATRAFTLPADLVTAVRNYARTCATTPYVVLWASLSIVLARFSGQQEVIVGSPVAGRPRADFDGVVGYFVNVVPLRADLSGDPTMTQLVRSLRERILDALENQDYPFPRIVEDLQVRRDASRTPVFQALLALERSPQRKDEALSHVALGIPGASAKLGSLAVETYPVEHRAAQFDVAMMLSESSVGMHGSIQYNCDLFDASTIDRLATHFVAIVQSATSAASADESIWDIPLVELASAGESAALLREVNDTGAPIPSPAVHQLFEAQSRRSPDAVAVVSGGQALTYQELDRRAGVVAARLSALGGGPETVVALCVDRSDAMLVGVLGILKAGAAYVPLDPAYPQARLEYMLRDCGAKVIVTERSVAATLPLQGKQTLWLDEEGPVVSALSGSRPALADQLAYVIYTSGSTGGPKGVQVTHGAVTNFLASMRTTLGFTARDVMLAVTSLSFDIAVLELLMPLLSGGRVVIAPRSVVADGQLLASQLRESGATVMQATPVTWRLVIESMAPAPTVTALSGGETLSQPLADRLLERCGCVWNLYGPTETTVWSTAARVDGSRVSIGRPIANTQVVVLDRRDQLVPVGVAGELLIGGVGLARGYLGQPSLTAERFCCSSLGGAVGDRAYRTGDFVRLTQAGSIEHLGRLDNQVKLRGHRLELSEIEAELRAQGDVRDAVVVLRTVGPDDARLVAYVETDAADREAELRLALRGRLPEYAVPALFVALAALPRTPNGKVDRRALPAPDVTALQRSEYVAPRSPLEEQVCEVLREVLRVDRVSVTASFFDMGGHSLLLAQVANRLRTQFEVELSLAQLFEDATAAGVALAITKAQAEALGADAATLVAEVEDLSPEELDRLLAAGGQEY